MLDKVPLKLEAGAWYTLLLEMQGKDVVASIDGQQTAFGTGERIDVDKTSVQLRIRGESVALKNLRVWEATPSDTWEATRAKLLDARKTKDKPASEADTLATLEALMRTASGHADRG